MVFNIFMLYLDFTSLKPETMLFVNIYTRKNCNSIKHNIMFILILLFLILIISRNEYKYKHIYLYKTSYIQTSF